MGFIDDRQLKALQERVAEAYLNLGLTIVNQMVTVDDGDLVLITAAIVRKTAYEQMTQDTTTREQFSEQMAADADSRIDAQLKAISKAIEDGRAMKVLTGEEDLTPCAHTRTHEGLCLDCQKEIT